MAFGSSQTFNAAGFIDKSFVSPSFPENRRKMCAVGCGVRRLKKEVKGSKTK